ncbi:MAG: hypothetical protein IPM36_12935 [Lewinellaceae bacterium]|nr:hypothetical protein [Lewinellaceae bacterium]
MIHQRSTFVLVLLLLAGTFVFCRYARRPATSPDMPPDTTTDMPKPDEYPPGDYAEAWKKLTAWKNRGCSNRHSNKPKRSTAGQKPTAMDRSP